MKKASKTDKKLVTDILVSAFAPLKKESSINLIVKQDKKRIERMHILMEYLFDKSMDNGEVYISQNEQACILLKIRKNEKFNLKTILQDIRLVLKCIGIERIYSVIKRQRIVKRNYPKEHHIRPMIIGSKSESKGNGSAARLMLEVINKYKNNKLPVIIDASSEHNARLYQKLGFKTIKIETDLGFPIYILRLN